jgi:NAD(P)H-dependent flavin oxidoreductase YrpB (nitropropane dioxygenase family)
MKTALCDKLGTDVPIIQAPMGGASCPKLAAAVSNAGGLGMLALSFVNLDGVRRQIRETRALTQRPFGVNLILDFDQQERLAACLEEGVPIISFFWGDPTSLVGRVHETGAVILHTAADATEARRAVEAGADIIVAQGWEAGGHVRGHMTSLCLIPSVVDAVAPTPVVAAGGIADGRGFAAVLALGASGAWIGTRFLAAEEAAIHPRYREILLQANGTDTVYTQLFDVGWPNAPHRVLRNSTVRTWEAAGHPRSGNRPGEGQVLATSSSRGAFVHYRSATPGADAEGDIEALSLWAGQGVGLVRRVQGAADIVHEIVEEARSAIRSSGVLVAS